MSRLRIPFILSCLMFLAGCVTGGAPSVGGAASVPVPTLGGYDLRQAIPPLTYVGQSNAEQRSGRVSIVYSNSIRSVCATVDMGGCVTRSGGSYVINVDASLPEWMRTIVATHLSGHVGQMIMGRPVGHGAACSDETTTCQWSPPQQSLLTDLGAYRSSTPARAPAVLTLTYAQVWGGEPPEPYYSNAVRLRNAGAVPIQYLPLAEIEQECGRRRDDNGWVQTACQVTRVINREQVQVILIASEVPASARENIEIHEIAHTEAAGGWPADHPGGLKPRGHLDACIASMNVAGFSLREMRDLCYLDGGEPLRTQEERDRYAAMR